MKYLAFGRVRLEMGYAVHHGGHGGHGVFSKLSPRQRRIGDYSGALNQKAREAIYRRALVEGPGIKSGNPGNLFLDIQ